MRTITYSKARQELADTMQKVIDDRNPLLITRQNGGNCVLLSEEHYNSLEETAYLLRSPANAARLSQAIEDINNDLYNERDIIE
ncbi:YoeB-YefM toxin-antitoxin system antitoxin YefM [Cedecea neteri]|uniref:YoeB-YefM toxin-antitoxin system antitoxin YefM n=1 Tax=Cedecea neteri TaxID=158822 RepID=UPI00289F4870|nr:YoeB-YefM toxin-antitoxin system antitoxin YefM [Cedecea neteri]